MCHEDIAVCTDGFREEFEEVNTVGRGVVKVDAAADVVDELGHELEDGDGDFGDQGVLLEALDDQFEEIRIEPVKNVT